MTRSKNKINTTIKPKFDKNVVTSSIDVFDNDLQDINVKISVCLTDNFVKIDIFAEL